MTESRYGGANTLRIGTPVVGLLSTLLFLIASAVAAVNDRYQAYCLLVLALCLAVAFAALMIGSWPVLIMALYAGVCFGLRPLFVLSDLSQLNTFVGESEDSYRHGLGVSLIGVSLGVVAALGGAMIHRNQRSVDEGVVNPTHRTMAHRSPNFISRLFVLGVVGMIGLVLLARSVGGLANAFSQSKVIRTELTGELYPLFAVWTMQAGCLVVLASDSANKRVRFFSWALLLFGGVSGVLSGSRGAVAPLIVAGLYLEFARRTGARRLRAVGAAALLAILLVIFGAYKEYSVPGQAVSQSLTGQNLTAQFNESDYFALVAERRSALPSGVDIGISDLQAPLYVLPRFIFAAKATPYDYYVRSSIVGGIVSTGLPASLFGESWLIGGYAGIVFILGTFGLSSGWLQRRFASGSACSQTCWAVFVGVSYLMASRPLLLSVSRLISLELSVLVAASVLGRWSRSVSASKASA